MSSYSRKVLILNADYSAFGICSVYRAFLLVYTHKAETLVESEDEVLRSVNQRFQVPSIIRLHRYINRPYRGGVVLNRQNIFKRDNNCCQYCGSTKDLTLDHVIPRSRGGRTSWDNLITACKPCNSKKGDLTPEEAGMPLMQEPFKPSFVMFLRDFHGRISRDWLSYLGQRS